MGVLAAYVRRISPPPLHCGVASGQYGAWAADAAKCCWLAARRVLLAG